MFLSIVLPTRWQPPPPPRPPPPQYGAGHGHVSRDDVPLFEALYVVSVEKGSVDEVGGVSGGGASPRSSVEAFQRANQQSPPRVVWRYSSSV